MCEVGKAQLHNGEILRIWDHHLVRGAMKGEEGKVKTRKGKRAWAGWKWKDVENHAVQTRVAPEEGVKNSEYFMGDVAVASSLIMLVSLKL